MAPEIAPVNGYYGEPANVTQIAPSPPGVETARVPYTTSFRPQQGSERHPKKCVADDFTCNGWKAKGTNYCVGHLRSRGEL